MKQLRAAALLFIVLFLYAAGPGNAAPTTFLPLGDRAYDFIERMEHRFVSPRTVLGTKPATRRSVARILRALREHRDHMTGAERQEYDALFAAFAGDMIESGGISWDDDGPVPHIPGFLSTYLYRNRRNLFTKQGENYRVFLDPVIVRRARIADTHVGDGSDNIYTSENGFMLRGGVGDHVGFHIDVRDAREWGDRSYPAATATTLPGHGYAAFKDDHAEYDETYSHVTYSSGPFVLMYGRDRNVWGWGRRGSLLLSEYGAPYDMFRLDTTFGNARFTFFTGELKQHPPVARFYYQSQPGQPADSVTVKKHIAGHRLELAFGDRLNIGLHETVVYGGRWEMSYLNPVMFLKGGEHYNGDHDNAAMGADFRFFFHRSHSVYGELLIDDITTTKLGTDWYGNKLAWQLGTLLVFPFGLRNSDIRIEYTRIQPWVYTHRYPLNTYTHYGDVLGHVLGPNSDEIYAQFRKRFSRRLKTGLYFARSRHGANPAGENVGGDPLDGFSPGDRKTAAFLDGVISERTVFGASCSYEIAWECFLRLGYEREIVDDDGINIFTFSLGLRE